MSPPVVPPPAGHPRRPLLGLRRKPGRLALAVFRMPLRAYRHDAGWLLGHTFLEFVHTGRKSGQPYETVAMVLRYDADAHEAIICAGWDTDWVRNLRAGPAVQVRLGRESFTPQHRFLSDDEAFDVAVGFRREHPRRMRLISTILGWGDLRDDAAVRGFIQTPPVRRVPPGDDQPGLTRPVPTLSSAEVQQRGYTIPRAGNHQHPGQPRNGVRTARAAAGLGRRGPLLTLC